MTFEMRRAAERTPRRAIARRLAPGPERQRGPLILRLAHVGAGEDLVLRDPLEGFLEGLLGVGLEHQALARTPAARIHLGMPAGRELLLVVVRVAVGPQVDVALGALEG